MHPENQPDAVLRIICLPAERQDLLRCGEHGLPYDARGLVRLAVKRLDDRAGVLRNLIQRLGPIQMLAAGDKPNLIPFDSLIWSLRLWNQLFRYFAESCPRP